MWWMVSGIAATIVAAVGTVASVNGVRFARRIASEVRGMNESPSALARIDYARLAELPPPVQRYLAKAIATRSDTVIRRVHLRHGGRFRPSLGSAWLPVKGDQYFTTDPPGFIWWGRVRLGPGLWVDARDRSLRGAGNMLVMLESTMTLADSSGPQLDQGALLRLLGEIAWFPSVFLDRRYIDWTPIDRTRARATLRVNGRTVSGEFEFGADDLPAAFFADRYRDVGGRGILTPFVGQFSDFRVVDGMLVPFRAVAAWIVEGKTSEYADFDVRHLHYDWAAPV